MNLVFLGPPGSGKGTQAKTLAEKLNVPHVCLGDMLTEEVRQKTKIGERIKEIMDTGNLVPDEITIGLTAKRIAECKSGFILDGFPRSAPQAEALDKIFAEAEIKEFKVVYFKVDLEKVVERLSGRRSCKSCGAVYHVKFKQPKVADKCDLCGGELYQRKDDLEKAIRIRFEVYEKQSKPIIDRYEEEGELISVKAEGEIKEVFSALLSAIGYGRN